VTLLPRVNARADALRYEGATRHLVHGRGTTWAPRERSLVLRNHPRCLVPEHSPTSSLAGYRCPAPLTSPETTLPLAVEG